MQLMSSCIHFCKGIIDCFPWNAFIPLFSYSIIDTEKPDLVVLTGDLHSSQGIDDPQAVRAQREKPENERDAKSDRQQMWMK